MLVEATQLCFYDHKRRRAGEQFEISNEKEFSSTYMVKVEDLEPVKKVSRKALKPKSVNKDVI